MTQLSSTVQLLSTTMHKNQAETKGELSDLKNHVSQLAASVSAFANESSRLLSKTIQIQEDVNALTLRSGKRLSANLWSKRTRTQDYPKKSK
ncbi:unnamed protein product [Rhodiola kirilowii]